MKKLATKCGKEISGSFSKFEERASIRFSLKNQTVYLRINMKLLILRLLNFTVLSCCVNVRERRHYTMSDVTNGYVCYHSTARTQDTNKEHAYRCEGSVKMMN
jgi:hypothetical protein